MKVGVFIRLLKEARSGSDLANGKIDKLFRGVSKVDEF